MHFFQIIPFIEKIGLLGIFFMVFAESGLFFGFFLPGDSLLFTAGFLAAAGYFNITFLFIGSFLCAILGDGVGYVFGQRLGPKIFAKPDSFLFNKRNLEKTARFYERYGKKAITLARFVPIVRTFAPILAGASNMPYSTFSLFNFLGALVWTAVMCLSGYFLGSHVKNVDKYIFPIIGFIVLTSLVPVAVEFFRKRRYNK